MKSDNTILVPPKYCMYVLGECDQSFDDIKPSAIFFIYPSQPPLLAQTIKECVSEYNQSKKRKVWLTWEDLSIGGRIIFCEICKAMRGSQAIVANITNINFNVLFELGYAVGLNKPILPVRDSTYESQKRPFDEIGIFDSLGYEQFTNSIELMDIIKTNNLFTPSINVETEINYSQPIYFIRSPIDNDGSIKLLSSLKKSWYGFRTFDSRETPRLSLHDSYKQVLSSVSVIAHLIDPQRTGALVHNARAAFLCGMALAAGKQVLMFQEENVTQPIDYRELVIPYTDTKTIPHYIEIILRATSESIQTFDATHVSLPKGLLEKIDLGDVAAENEIKALTTYFVKTPQFQQAKQGHARIVVGRKGTGKTALFYGIRGQFSSKSDKIILDLKPEGHQFIRLREIVLNKLTEGYQLHTLTAFWHYLLLLEIAKKLIDREQHLVYQDPTFKKPLEELEALYEGQLKAQGDFSERLMTLVNRVIEHFPNTETKQIDTNEITNAIYRTDINKLNNKIIEHLENFDGVLILFDNIDKGFPTHGLLPADVLIIRSLLEATRKLQTSLQTHNIECITTIFLRKDVYDHLIDFTPDRGKESYVNLDWSDIDLLKELLLRRIRYQAPELEGSFEDVWSKLFEPHVGVENSFKYIIARTFLRPRDVLNFVRKCIQIAVSHGHDKVTQEEILTAEEQFSADMLDELRYEIRDIFPELPDFALYFLNLDSPITLEEIYERLKDAGVPDNKLDQVKNILLWFSFFGIHIENNESYSYQLSYDVAKLEAQREANGNAQLLYVIHPAFKKALTV